MANNCEWWRSSSRRYWCTLLRHCVSDPARLLLQPAPLLPPSCTCVGMFTSSRHRTLFSIVRADWHGVCFCAGTSSATLSASCCPAMTASHICTVSTFQAKQTHYRLSLSDVAVITAGNSNLFSLYWYCINWNGPIAQQQSEEHPHPSATPFGKRFFPHNQMHHWLLNTKFKNKTNHTKYI